jgi:hypothetical protein
MQESNKNQFALQDSNVSCLDLGLCLKGHNDNLDSRKMALPTIKL